MKTVFLWAALLAPPAVLATAVQLPAVRDAMVESLPVQVPDLFA